MYNILNGYLSKFNYNINKYKGYIYVLKIKKKDAYVD